MTIDELYSEYFSDIFCFSLRLSGDQHTAEDLTAETFFRAMKALDSFRGDCSIRVWLCRIAKNTYLSYLKKNRRSISMEEGQFLSLPDGRAGPEEFLLDHADSRQIQEILHELENPYKEVFMWRVFAEMSFEQIGSLFGKSANWACVVYHRARKKIIEQLEDEA